LRKGVQGLALLVQESFKPNSRPAACLLLAFVFPGFNSAARAANVIPTQFIAKMYTEALGRAPDQNGWTAYVEGFQKKGCTAAELSKVGQSFYNSVEFNGDYSDNEAKVLALYRGALNRDPDPGGFYAYVSLLNSGTPWASVVNEVFSSAEFANDVATICNSNAPNYHFGGQPPVTPLAGVHGLSGLSEWDLQVILNATQPGQSVVLAQKSVVVLNSTLVIPAGVTLTTYGSPATTSYALMARLMRGSTFGGPSIRVQGGGQLLNLWIDGQRNVLGYYKVGGGGDDNANIVTLGGTNTTISYNKLSDPQGGTNFFSAPGTPAAPCSNQTVQSNLITAYSADHGFSVNSDGLTMACEGLNIRYNNIVDVTDIAIVLFASPAVTQRSTIMNNVIVSAGISMNAPISSDPSTGNPGGSSISYAGTVFTGNTFWTGPYTTFDFGIEAGAREYFPTANNSDGSGATYIKNTTGTLSARVRAGIAVAGMLKVTITNDSNHPLQFIFVSFPPNTPAAGCPGGAVISEAAQGDASGVYPAPTFNGSFDGCI
jgi:hypothetical protein